MQITILRSNGAEEVRTVDRAALRNTLCRELACTAFAFVRLPRNRTMWLDDTGLIDGKEHNPSATKLYWSACIPGTTHPIAGDVALVPNDEDECEGMCGV